MGAPRPAKEAADNGQQRIQALERRDRLYTTMRRLWLVSRVIGPEGSGACADLKEGERYELAALLDEAAGECNEIAEWLDQYAWNARAAGVK